QACEAAGIEVPNLCYQPLLRPWGSCRLCTVEILGQRGGLIESCATPVRDGMEVLTLSEDVVEARQFILQMYLVDHALDCPTCDKSGECYLQDNTYLHNVNNNPYRRPKLAQPYKHLSSYIDYKWDRCIICARCTRVCHEMIGVTAIEVVGRGLEAEISPAYGVDLADTTCTNCGMCIAVCPVGALTDRHFGHHPWELDATQTICGLCDVGCTINIEHTRGFVRRSTHLWDRGVNLGYTCERGRWGHEKVQDPMRLRYPLVREGSDYLEIDLDEALDLVAEKLRHYQGPQFAALASPDNTNEDNYVLQQFTRAVMNSNSIDRLISPAQAAVDRAMSRSFGVPASSAGMQEMMTDANAVLVVGPSVGETEPVASYWLYWAERYREATMIVINREGYPLADRSDHWLPARPGTEASVLKAMLRVIADEGLATPGMSAADLANLTRNVDVSAVARDSGVDEAALRESAILYATGGQGKSDDPDVQYPASAIWHSMAASTVDNVEETAIAANNLAIACGNIGLPGGGVLALRLNANMQGSLDVGCRPDLLPGGASIADAASRTALSEVWSTRWNEAAVAQNGFKTVRELPTGAGVPVTDLPLAIERGEIKAMYISAQSHFWSGDPDPELLAALAKLEFLVVEDAFESELTRLAHVVLPAAMYLEKDGTFTNMDRTVQRVRFAVTPPGEASSSLWLVGEIAERLGYSIETGNVSAILDEIGRFVPSYSGISLPRLERGGIQWPVQRFGADPSVFLSVGNGLVAEDIRVIAD
ncbi:MAG TPA: molybdopterin-dependent oxidoreductase, partial [Thermomicrobiales bacterium]|nr:molybdopterin-dependent oxidoreductase [Thermomicrobiales bacterium]